MTQGDKVTSSKKSKAGTTQGLRIATALPEDARFNSQLPHGVSQPCIMGSNALFWPAVSM